LSGSHSGGKEKIAEYFRANANAKPAEHEQFVKSAYSHYSGHSRSGYGSNGTSKGLELARKYQKVFGHDVHQYLQYDKVLLNWRDVARRINAAVKAGVYFPEKAEKAAEVEAEPVPEVKSEPKPPLKVADNGSPAPVFYVDWNKAQHDIDLSLYKDGDIIGYDKDGKENKVGKSGGLTYVTTTGAVMGSNNVPSDIFEQAYAYHEGGVSENPDSLIGDSADFTKCVTSRLTCAANGIADKNE
jgi:hypothetical protein